MSFRKRFSRAKRGPGIRGLPRTALPNRRAWKLNKIE